MNKGPLYCLRTTIVLAVVLLVSLCRAGHYRITVTGGTFTKGESTSSYLGPAYFQSGTLDSVYYQGGDPSFANPSQTYSHCSGALTAQCVWEGTTPGEAPPKTIIVRESINAGGGFASERSGTCDATTGVTGEQVTPSVPTTPSKSKFATVVRYAVMHDASSFTLSCSPEASASCAYNNDNQHDGARSKVYYGVDVVEPRMKVYGGLSSTGDNFLVGQRMTANVDPYVQGTTANWLGLTPNYTWKATGADPFKSFMVLDYPYGPPPSSSGPDIATGTRVDLTAVDLSAPSLVCCFAKDESTLVGCKIHFAVPAGSLPTEGLDVEMASGPRTVLKPITTPIAASFTYNTTLYYETMRGPSGKNGPFALAHFDWTASVKTPTGYPDQGDDKGGWLWLQLVTVTSSRVTNADVTQYHRHIPPSGGAGWTSGIDVKFGYKPDDAVPSNPGAFYQSRYKIALYYADGTLNGTSDAPSVGFTSDAKSYNLAEDFGVWQMYLPPGIGSQFVPLQRINWTWGGQVSWDGGLGHWVLSSPKDSMLTPSLSSPSWQHRMLYSRFQFVP